MKVSLWTLNESYQALARLASRELPKEQFKITFKLARIFKDAKRYIDRWGQEDIAPLMARFNIKQMPDGSLLKLDKPEEKATADQIEAFNKAAKAIMQEEVCELVGDHYGAFQAEELLKVVSISSLDLGLLYGWLIDGELPEDAQEEKAIGASA
jgi:hypothetical protein